MKRIIFIVIVIVFFVIAHNMIQNIVSLWQKQNIVTQTEDELVRVKAENKQLKSQLEMVNQPGFIESEARDKLFYVKPGEQIVFIPQTEEIEEETSVDVVSDPAWKQWLDLFFGAKEV